MAAFPWKVAWVTGASSGIGEQIAVQLARSGVKVAASARSLRATERPGNIIAFPLDVSNATDAAACVSAIEATLGPIDLAVFAAGAYEPFDVENCRQEAFARLNAVNYLGVINCMVPLMKRMKERRHGHLSWIASVTAYHGLLKAGYYGPTKAALNNLAESLEQELASHGIAVSVINPGFVRTPMVGANDFAMPFIMSPEDAATRTLDGLSRGRFDISYPLRLTLWLKLMQRLPRRLSLPLLRWITSPRR